MEQKVVTERVLQELHLLTHYISTVPEPDPKFIRVHTQQILKRLDELEAPALEKLAA